VKWFGSPLIGSTLAIEITVTVTGLSWLKLTVRTETTGLCGGVETGSGIGTGTAETGTGTGAGAGTGTGTGAADGMGTGTS